MIKGISNNPEVVVDWDAAPARALRLTPRAAIDSAQPLSKSNLEESIKQARYLDLFEIASKTIAFVSFLGNRVHSLS